MAGLGRLGKALGKGLIDGAGKLKDEFVPKRVDTKPPPPAADVPDALPSPLGAEELPPAPEDMIPATGMEPTPRVDQPEMDEIIQETGAQGELGPMEAGELYGRAPPRRNINLDFFEDESTKATIELYNRRANGFLDNPQRDVQSHDETIAKSVAGSVDLPEMRTRMKKIIGGDINDKWEPEDLVGIYHMMEKQGAELTSEARRLKAMRAAGAEPSTEDFAHYQLLSARFVATQEIASVRAAEAGRMLNALQAVKKAGGRQYYEDMDNLVRGAGGKESLWTQIDAVSGARSLEDTAAAAKQGFWAKVYHTAVQVRYNMMLSSVRTHAANIAGSAATGAYESLVINPLKIAINNTEFVGRAMLNATFGRGGMLPEDRIAMSELISVPRDTVKSMRAAFANARDVFNGEAMGHGKIYNEMGVSPNDSSLGGGGMVPKAVQVPTRLLEAEDAFFRSMYFNSKLSQLAQRKAAKVGTDEKTYQEAYAAAMRSPDTDMLDAAKEYAGKLTFTNDPSAYGSALSTFAKTMSTIQDHPVGRLILPFVRTPANLFGYALEQGAVGKAMAPRKLFNELTQEGPEARADAEARIAIAAGLYVYLKDHWDSGDITGAPPPNYGITRARQAVGWRENSIRIGDQYYQLNRLDPLGLILAGYATAYSATEHTTVEDKPTAVLASIAQVASMLTDRSVLSGLGDLERVFQASEGSVGKQAGKQVARIATSFFIPALARDVREGADPYKRSLDVPDDFGGATWAAVKKATMNAWPGASKNLPPQIDAFGQDMLNTGGMIWRGIVPIRRGEIKQDPVAAALIATATPVNKPDHQISLIPNGPKVDLLQMDGGRGWVYRSYQQAVGKARHTAVKKLTQSKAWQRLVDDNLVGPDTDAADSVGKMVREARRTATLSFLKTMAGKKSYYPTVAGEQVAGEVVLENPLDMDRYKELTRLLLLEGATPENMRQVEGAGLKYKHKPTQKGLPPEMRF